MRGSDSEPLDSIYRSYRKGDQIELFYNILYLSVYLLLFQRNSSATVSRLPWSIVMCRMRQAV